MKNTFCLCIATCCAGAVTGILGAGGGMILVPLLSLTNCSTKDRFSSSLLLMSPICAVSLFVRLQRTSIPWSDTSIYLIGGAIGGLCAGIWGKYIPQHWLHRLFGVIILFGGFRFLWN